MSTYGSEEQLRQRIYSSLYSVPEKIREAGAYESFWNITYQGQRIVQRTPKREVEAQHFVECILSDQMLLANIEVVPDARTGVGNVDFKLVGFVNGQGMVPFCAEFKNAHSDDIYRGLELQLPAYMRQENASYGAYCVLNYRGDWFRMPQMTRNELEVELTRRRILAKDPLLSSVRVFIYNLSRPITASRL